MSANRSPFVVHVVDDDAAVRDSLSFLIQSASYAIRSYNSAHALLARVAELEPGCIVTDVRMPGMNGLELVNQLKAVGNQHPIIVLTGHADVALAVVAMKAGVLEFLEKPFDDAILLQAISSALEYGENIGALANERRVFENRLALLTPRERAVFGAVVEGDSNKVAATRLGISPRTVEIYRANVMEKMQARSLSELVRTAIRGGHA